MPNATHTPGPWTVVGQTAGPLPGRYVENARGATIAEVRCGTAHNDRQATNDERLANARLIAAAPRMLEALRLVAQLQHDRMCAFAIDHCADCVCGLREARAILRELEG